MICNKLYWFIVAVITLLFLTIVLYANDQNSHSQILDFDQFDSLCVNDSIPRNLKLWENQDYVDANDKVKTKYTLNVKDSVIYNVKPLDDGFFYVSKENIK